MVGNSPSSNPCQDFAPAKSVALDPRQTLLRPPNPQSEDEGIRRVGDLPLADSTACYGFWNRISSPRFCGNLFTTWTIYSDSLLSAVGPPKHTIANKVIVRARRPGCFRRTAQIQISVCRLSDSVTTTRPTAVSGFDKTFLRYQTLLFRQRLCDDDILRLSDNTTAMKCRCKWAYLQGLRR